MEAEKRITTAIRSPLYDVALRSHHQYAFSRHRVNPTRQALRGIGVLRFASEECNPKALSILLPVSSHIHRHGRDSRSVDRGCSFLVSNFFAF